MPNMHNAPGLSTKQKGTIAMTAELRRAIEVLRFSNAELHSFLKRAARTNVFLVLQMAPSVPRPRAGHDRRDRRAERAIWPGHGSDTEFLSARPLSLIEHVARQIDVAIAPGRARRIAFAFLEMLEPTGWLGTDIAETAEACGCTEAEAEAVLVVLQQLEPAGLFARSLAECLRLQAREDGALDGPFSTMLDNLELIAEGDIAAVAKACGTGVDDVVARLDRLRTYNPKPGIRFLDTDIPIRPPDLLLRARAGGWAVELNGSTLPELVISDAPANGDTGLSPADAEALAQARSLKSAVDQRNAHTLAVAAEIVRRQSAFMENREAPPVPLKLQEVAEAVGLHASSVSRIVNGMTIEAPRGVIELRRCFSRGLPAQGEQDAVSVESVKQRIRQLLDLEAPSRPLSDERICTALKDAGIQIERRTVAKYRTEMSIPSSTLRRRATRRGARRGSA